MIVIHETVTRVGVNNDTIRYAAQYVLRALKNPKAVLTVHIVGEARMRNLNNARRGINRPTDVLSFAATEGDVGNFFPKSDELGDIFLCPSYIRRQAANFNISYKEEFVRMLIHGILHISGYDHQKEADAKRMFSMQESLLGKVI